MHAKNANSHAMPGCGKCGYPAQGISTLNCPECGADLRAVGIKKSGQIDSPVYGCVIPLVFSIVFFIVCTASYQAIESEFPAQYGTWKATVTLTPRSGEYVNALVEFEAIPPSGSQSPSAGFSSNAAYPGSGHTTSLSTGGATVSGEITKLSIVISPVSPQASAWRSYRLEVDPITRRATWTDQQGKTYQTKGVFTDQDVVDFLDRAGADITRADVIQESQELYAILDGLATGMDQFVVNSFQYRGQSLGAGGSYQNRPVWFDTVYLIACVVIWILGLFFIFDRRRRRLDYPNKILKNIKPAP